jgi:hypothetical protein
VIKFGENLGIGGKSGGDSTPKKLSKLLEILFFLSYL